MDYEIINEFPHDKSLWTQGLQIFHDCFYESHGLVGFSGLRRYSFDSVCSELQISLPDYYYAEGLTILNERIYVLTLSSQVCLVFNMRFELVDQFSYSGQGWGLTNNGSLLIKGDGTDKIKFIDPTTRQVEESIRVTDNNVPLTKLNELEWVDGFIYGNVWDPEKPFIYKVEPTTGNVVKTYNIYSLVKKENWKANGIAYREKSDTFFLTGKNWRKIYEIKLFG